MCVLDVNEYIADGFKKVCDVVPVANTWMYKNIKKELMFDEHNSWVYFIVVDQKIYKVGETGQPLGIPASRWYPGFETQPLTGTKCRFGRYRQGDQTDSVIRAELKKEAHEGRVSLWARKCEIIQSEVVVAGTKKTVRTSFHKDLEKHYLDHIVKGYGCLPYLNKGRA